MDNHKVIKLSKQGLIAVVTMEEREYGNTFTPRFIKGMMEAFAALTRDTAIKVVLVHGCDNYFCCGGTKEELITLHKGAGKEEDQQQVKFTDTGFHDLFLRCELPVIAALQGHALGAGLALGCTADIMVMGEQCIYSANFMKYGFTPGFGATYIVPKKLGEALGNEMLFTARSYYGRELKERGAPVKIVSRKEVMETAFHIAGDLADKPLVSLKVLKKHLAQQVQPGLSAAIEKELAMHRITFPQPEVRDRIEGLFGN
ncbi:MAG: enoyl-CoA hydratase/isomerase family protein [Candidatus Aminicenantes bacterium]|nr:MAG: enoyl-CoA hydratase/isomerase family protein [Candidatus Aminicenantes bacterium]